MTLPLPHGFGALHASFDDVSLTYLVLFAALWTLGGLYAAVTTPSGQRARLFAYFVPSAIGGTGVAVAGDAIGFYLAFALMALPAWGLITHTGTPEARRAGATYLGITALGEALLLAALMLMAAESGTTELARMTAALAHAPARNLVLALLVAAIGLKIGALPFSGVLPLTYTHTPAGPASALAGASVKVGALAMLRLLPAGGASEGWSAALIVVGLLTAFVAAALGTLTTHPRAVLGYSSASQMGLVTIAAGAALADARVAPLAHAAIIAFSIHHGFAKSALVIGDDVVGRMSGRLRSVALAALALPAASLIGAPLTSGFVAKYALKDALHALAGPVPAIAYAALPWTAVGTAALMLRFFTLVRARPASGSAARSTGPLALWAVSLVFVAVAAWVWPASWSEHARSSALSLPAMWTALWPALLAGAAAVALIRVPHLRRAAHRVSGAVVPGDLLAALPAVVVRLDRVLRGIPRRTSGQGRHGALAEMLLGAEARAVVWTTAATIAVILALVLVLLATL